MPDIIKKFIPFISLLLLCIIIFVREPLFLSADNLAGVARQTAVITVMAMGMTMVLLYYDQRVRRESYNAQALSEDLMR